MEVNKFKLPNLKQTKSQLIRTFNKQLKENQNQNRFAQ